MQPPTPVSCTQLTPPKPRPFFSISDFAGAVHFRHPLEMGGFYWCLNLALSQASCFVAAKLYKDYADIRDGPTEVEELYIGSNVTADSAAAEVDGRGR